MLLSLPRTNASRRPSESSITPITDAKSPLNYPTPTKCPWFDKYSSNCHQYHGRKPQDDRPHCVQLSDYTKKYRPSSPNLTICHWGRVEIHGLKYCQYHGQRPPNSHRHSMLPWDRK